MVDYKQKIVELLENHMTEKGFKLWSGINSILPDIWNKPTSSTGKWHKKMNGEVPTQAEHVYHLLYATSKIMRLFGYKNKTSDGDKLLFAVALHDSLKYGALGNRKHTDNGHDKEAADMVASNKETFLKVLSKEQFYVLEEAVRFHSGQWSKDVPKDKKFDFKDFNPETLFVHILDMMSTADLIQTDVRE
jgi:hypothetical protein